MANYLAKNLAKHLVNISKTSMPASFWAFKGISREIRDVRFYVFNTCDSSDTWNCTSWIEGPDKFREDGERLKGMILPK